jgi:salicylate hydroxylase
MDGYDPTIQRLIRMAPDAIRTKFVNRGLVEDWMDEDCKVVLLGEAAHPVMPCGIYGSSLGVEDAAVLGVLMSRLRTESQIPLLLEAYQDLRQPRCQAVASSEFSNASLVWLPPGPERDARDAGMRASLSSASSAATTPSEEQLREQYETIGEVFGYSAREAAEDWWVQWGSLGESSRGNHVSVYEPLDLKFEIKEVTTRSDAPNWVKDLSFETKISV